MFVQLAVLLLIMIPVLAIVLDSSVGKALASRLEGRRLSTGDEAPERMLQLEHEVERLATEVTRLSDESEFLHKLLAERPSPGSLPPGSEADS